MRLTTTPQPSTAVETAEERELKRNNNNNILNVFFPEPFTTPECHTLKSGPLTLSMILTIQIDTVAHLVKYNRQYSVFGPGFRGALVSPSKCNVLEGFFFDFNLP